MGDMTDFGNNIVFIIVVAGVLIFTEPKSRLGKLALLIGRVGFPAFIIYALNLWMLLLGLLVAAASFATVCLASYLNRDNFQGLCKGRAGGPNSARLVNKTGSMLGADLARLLL